MYRSLSLLSLILALLVTSCSTGRNATQLSADVPAAAAVTDTTQAPLQALVYDVTPPLPFQRAIRSGTRTRTGQPGPQYWQQEANYQLTARVFPEEKRLEGTGRIQYTNNAPRPLQTLHLELIQNVHAEGAHRGELMEVTGGVDLTRVTIDGQDLQADVEEGPGYIVNGTQLVLFPPENIAPGATVTLEVDWRFTIPQAGASGRMGYSGEDLLYVGYWYPIMSVYDDVDGWYTDPFTGGAEFYADHGNYELTVEAPAGWLVQATGTLQNPDDVLAPEVLARMRQAHQSDTPMMIATPDTEMLTTGGDRLQWRFSADQVRDVAFHLSRNGFWEGARTPVGDRNEDGATDYAAINTYWRPEAPLWADVTRYQQHAITFESDYTGFPYPWPHMTAVEGGGIIGGGMEFPMMTLMGDYNQRGDSALYYVTAHELAHMWVPMIVSTNERRYSWMDEGMTTFLENQARADFFPGPKHFVGDQEAYIATAVSGEEGELMRRSDYHYSGQAFVIASYMKPAMLLRALQGVLGEDVFHQAYQTFISDWAYKHPYPYDFFNTFEHVSGRDLDWFWRSWYYETWTLDQAITAVDQQNGAVQVVVENQGRIPMPVLLTLQLANGETLQRQLNVDAWLRGQERTTVTFDVPAQVERVEIDPERYFPDVDRSDNVWMRQGNAVGG